MDKQEIEQRLHKFLQMRLSKNGTINQMMHMNLVRYDMHTKSVTLSFPVEEWQLNPIQHMHGGMICSALDITMGCIAYIFSEADFTPTISMSVNFVKAIKKQSILYVQGICEHSGSRLALTRTIAAVDENKECVASANGTYAINNIKHQHQEKT